MRISVQVEVLVNPETVQREELTSHIAMSTIGAAIENSLNDLGDLVYGMSITTKLEKEGPDAHN